MLRGEEQPECGNCGATEDLLRCSRCRSEWFCSLSCQKAYWPFHRDSCRKNEFADALDASEPKLAAWMRRHGKQAVLKDDEVERLERASKAACAVAGREELLQSMYGRLDPKAAPPSYSLDERRAMEGREAEEKRQARLMSCQDKAWQAIDIPEGLGMECGRYKWRQNQSHVEVYCLVPPGTDPKQVEVDLGRKHLSVGTVTDPDVYWVHGELRKEVSITSSTWYIADGVLHIYLLKTNRKGHYLRGATNADTWWPSLMAKAGPLELIPLQHPPTRYYWVAYEEDDLQEEERPRVQRLQPPAGRLLLA